MPQTSYGDISPRTAAAVAAGFLDRAEPVLVIEHFGQSKPLPGRKTQTMVFRRYNALDPTPKVLTEGVTPSSNSLTSTDVTLTLQQMGDGLQTSDIVIDTHEDPVLQQMQDVLGEQSGQMVELMRFGKLKAGTNVFYANGSARSNVNTTLTLALQRQITRSLKRQNAKKITRVVRSTPDYGTKPIAPSFIAFCHVDLENVIRGLAGFVPPEEYGQLTPYPSEIGKVEDVRYISSTIFEPWDDAGGAHGTMISTTGTSADVYPILYISRDAYAISALKGEYAITPMVTNPKASDSDPWAQRGWVTWKTMQGAVILNDAWMVRAEIAIPE